LYRLGAALFDLETAEQCLLRGDSWIFGLEMAYERERDVGYVTFRARTRSTPTATASTCTTELPIPASLAKGSVAQVLGWLDRHGTV